MNIKNLVPPLELCRKIPKEAFGDSAWVWTFDCGQIHTTPYLALREDVEFCRREIVNAPETIPAPTLQEIFIAMNKCSGISVVCITGGPFCDGIKTTARSERGTMSFPLFTGDDVAGNALRLWLNINHCEP